MASLDNLKQQGSSLAAGLKPYLIPAALGAAVGGPLMGYMSSRNHIEGEDPKTRRHRILRNALLGLTLGGVAGGAIPAGAESMFSPVKAMSGFHPIDEAANSTASHLGGVLGGGGVGALAFHRWGKNRGEAADLIHKYIGTVERNKDDAAKFTGSSHFAPETQDREVSIAKAMNPETQPAALAGAQQRLGGNQWKARELFGEAGIHNTPAIRNMGDKSTDAMLDLKQHLGDQGFISKLVSRLVPGTAEGAATALKSPFSPYRAAELYSKYLRPSVSDMAFKTEGPHLGSPLLLAGVAGGALAGDYAQKKLTGN